MEEFEDVFIDIQEIWDEFELDEKWSFQHLIFYQIFYLFTRSRGVKQHRIHLEKEKKTLINLIASNSDILPVAKTFLQENVSQEEIKNATIKIFQYL